MKELEKGQTINLRFKISTIREAEISSTIKNIEPDRISLNFPENKMELAKYLCEGKELEAVIYTDQGIYVFDSIVIESPLEIDFVIELPEERTKIQRREYVRVPIRLSLNLFKDNHKINTKTVNVGGGGIRFIADREFKTGDIWGFSMPIPHWNDPVKGTGCILYTIKQEKSIVSVIKFLNIDEMYRNKIIKMCFEEEAKRLKIRNSPYEGVDLIKSNKEMVRKF